MFIGSWLQIIATQWRLVNSAAALGLRGFGEAIRELQSARRRFGCARALPVAECCELSYETYNKGTAVTRERLIMKSAPTAVPEQAQAGRLKRRGARQLSWLPEAHAPAQCGLPHQARAIYGPHSQRLWGRGAALMCHPNVTHTKGAPTNRLLATHTISATTIYDCASAQVARPRWPPFAHSLVDRSKAPVHRRSQFVTIQSSRTTESQHAGPNLQSVNHG